MPLHAIIAGSNKCGTTSLFRYLADHPQVRPTRHKELLFFSQSLTGEVEQVQEEYRRQFVGGKRDARVWIEASPQYLHCGTERARLIHRYLPDARLIFLLRNPVDRLVSYYRADFGQRNRPSFGFRFAEVVDIGLAGLAGDLTHPRAAPFAQEIRMADYARYLREYAQVWPVDQLRVVFLEQLVQEPLVTVSAVAGFLGLDQAFYRTYEFEAENRTRGHRSAALQAIALRVNAGTEAVLAHVPRLKRALRSLYNVVNEAPIDVAIEREARLRLQEHYAGSVGQLQRWMAQSYPEQPLPAWLAGS